MLGQAAGYAATALGYVAAAGGKSVLVKDIAEACVIPPAYLAKIIHQLAKRGVVATQRGVGGGVSLIRPASQVSLLELCEALGDPILEPRCMLGVAQCSDERSCPAHQFWTAHRAQHIDFLTRTTIADLASFETRRRWNRTGPVGGATGENGANPHTRPSG
jgi:Rrf2 family protein